MGVNGSRAGRNSDLSDQLISLLGLDVDKVSFEHDIRLVWDSGVGSGGGDVLLVDEVLSPGLPLLFSSRSFLIELDI